MPFVKATKRQAKLKMALYGPSGSGKTYTALQIATHMGKSIALVDTEHGSASKYADIFPFDSMELETFHPQKYIDAIHEAERSGYDILIIDSLSHAWFGKDGALEMVDRAAKQNKSTNSFNAWRSVAPVHNSLFDAIVAARIHIIATMRSKTEYIVEQNERGKAEPRRVGMAPIQRSESEYEFDIVGELNQDNDMIIGKTRCPALSGKMFNRDGMSMAGVLSDWLSEGAPAPEPANERASFTPATNGADSRTRREKLIDRIDEVTEEALKLKLRCVLPRPLDEMRDQELIDYGKSLSQSIAQAKAQADMDEVFPDKMPAPKRNDKMKEEPLPL